MCGRCEMIYTDTHMKYGQSLLAARRDTVNEGERRWGAGRLTGAVAKEKKLWVNTEVVKCLSPSVISLLSCLRLSVAHIDQPEPPSKNKESYIFVNQVLYINSLWWYITNLELFTTDYFTLLRVFQVGVSWWFSTFVWVTASLLKSPGLFSVFWPFSTML